MNKKLWIGVGGVLLVGLLAAGIFFGIRLLRGGLTGANVRDGLIPSGNAAGAAGHTGGQTIIYTPAPEIPTRKADLSGLVTDVKDNSLIVQPQNGAVSVGPGSPAHGDATSPTKEVVVNENTRIFRDTTMDSQPAPQRSGKFGLQQTLEAMTVGQITKSQYIQVWGQSRGDRLFAEVIVADG